MVSSNDPIISVYDKSIGVCFLICRRGNLFNKQKAGLKLFPKSRKKLGIFAASFLVFVGTLTFLIYEGTKKTVALTIDGEEVVVKTHATTVEEVLNGLDVEVKDVDFLSHGLETVLKNDLSIVWEPAKQVSITIEGKEEKVWTTAKNVEELLQENDIALKEHDKIDLALEAEITQNMNISIERAFPFVLKDGTKEEEKLWSTSTTVADFLKQKGVTLGELDRVEPGLEEKITPDQEVRVIRVEKVTDVVEEPVDFAVVTKKDANMTAGNEKVIQAGKKGLLKKEYEVIKENGKETTRELKSEKTVRESEDKIVAVGTKVVTAQVSRGQSQARQPNKQASNRGTQQSGGKEFYVNATAFTADCNGCSGVTATGINLHANPNAKVIAVDPSVIPLGSKVWVEGYGYAVAGDTGGAIKGNRIDVFMNSKAQANRFGSKRVKVRVIN